MGRPDRRRLFHVQYRLNPARCQPTTVSGRTRCSDCRHLVHNLDRQIQKIRSNSVSRGRRSRAFHTASCCRSARFSSANSRCVRRQLLTVPKRIPSHRTMTGEIADQSAECKLIAPDDFLEGTAHPPLPIPRTWTQRESVYRRRELRLRSLTVDEGRR